MGRRIGQVIGRCLGPRKERGPHGAVVAKRHGGKGQYPRARSWVWAGCGCACVGVLADARTCEVEIIEKSASRSICAGEPEAGCSRMLSTSRPLISARINAPRAAWRKSSSVKTTPWRARRRWATPRAAGVCP